MSSKVSISFLSAILFLASVSPVFALSTPSFPTCPNPGGVEIANYSEGVHGIAGSQSTYTGSDVVYAINDSQVAQCYCPTDGSGIQTDWLNATAYTPEEKTELTKNGWIYIQDGSFWGLASHDWLAYNHSFICGGKGGGTILSSILGFADTGRALFFRRILLSIGLLTILTGLSILLLQSSAETKRKK